MPNFHADMYAIYVYVLDYMGVSKNRGTPKWMVYSGKPCSNGWFGGTTISGNIHIVSTVAGRNHDPSNGTRKDTSASRCHVFQKESSPPQRTIRLNGNQFRLWWWIFHFFHPTVAEIGIYGIHTFSLGDSTTIVQNLRTSPQQGALDYLGAGYAGRCK